MDAETQRLVFTALISASAAVIGGLGGAVFTARTNRLNTKDILDQAELQEERKHLTALEDEHASWLRDKKQEVYFDFLAVAENRYRQIFATKFSDIMEENHDLAVARSKLKLVGTSAVRSAALEIEVGLDRFVSAHIEISRAYLATVEDPANQEASDNLSELLEGSEEVYSKVSEHMVDFVEAVRIDIGSHSEDDEIINAENRTEQLALSKARGEADSRPPEAEIQLA